MSATAHFERLLALLDLESKAEAEQALARIRKLSGAEAQRLGVALVDLVIGDEEPGLGGRVVLTLTRPNPADAFPWHKLSIGTPVLASIPADHAAAGFRGVVCDRTERTIRIAVDQSPEVDDDARLRIDAANDEVARRRQAAAMKAAAASRGNRLAALVKALTGDEPPAVLKHRPPAAFDDSLNASQQAAVDFALTARDAAVIHGPPGTGKTTTLVELIRQAVGQGQRVLACAPSNIGVDNLLERLLAKGVAAVRLGHPARVLENLRAHTLDVLVDEHPEVALARRLAKKGHALRERAGRYTRAKPAPGAKRQMRQEAAELIADARRIEQQVVAHVLDTASVLCATTTGLDDSVLGGRRFDLCVIDEASQATEPACWPPILRAEKLVLAGDHFQLPPTILSAEAAKDGFGVSLLERLAIQHGANISRRLEVQYRMNRQIMEFSSREFYDGALIADERVADHLLRDLPGLAEDELALQPIWFIDTAGASYDEDLEPEGESRMNQQEAELTARLAERLLSIGLAERDLAVIAPYAAQVRLLRSLLKTPGLEIDTVDGFQGREKEAVIISLVRSNPLGEIGFLADVRRMNVALTRARRLLIVIGDSATIAAHPFYARLVDYVAAQGAHHSVWEGF
jgi:superfamily I DNA and/or RNA helicase